ncbi:MAG TPA: glycerol-3-phosphate dehydrogenase/oxidase [Isosphaeraceae bacterium]|jgi:glycerol-3-phosphate dehydrogenase|nr:glycerol-3-phosphate dehydrogenase/oxidase [Isosphaeraceae bacterium]
MDRDAALARLGSGEPWDLAVIGGGATGLGTALDAAARGYRTALVEAGDFARGTSSRSTKLIHGGLRYLARGEFRLVHEALEERGRLRANAPHLVHPVTFLIPSYSRWTSPYYGLGLKVYDLLAGRQNFGPSRVAGREEALNLVPTLAKDGLRGGVVYQDGQFDDARLAVALLRTFEDRGGAALNYVEARGILKVDGRTAGLRVRDVESGAHFDIQARAIVNATGVFADAVRAMDDPAATPMIAPSRGSHLVFGRAFLPGPAAVLVPKTDDGRVLFAIPWHGHALIGTTDTPVESAAVEPTPSAADIDYLLEHAGRYLSPPPTRADILGSFAGLRPLISTGHGNRTAALARDFAVVVSGSGLVTIAGGKWTTYRRMAEAAVDRAAEVAGLPPRPCPTADLRLHGWAEGAAAGPFDSYGSDAPALRALVADRPDLGDPLDPRLPEVLGVHAVWAARHELARTVEDVLSRRTRALLLDARASIAMAPRVADLIGDELGRDEEWRREQVRAFEALVNRYLPMG